MTKRGCWISPLGLCSFDCPEDGNENRSAVVSLGYTLTSIYVDLD